MITCSRACLEDHIEKMDVKAFIERYSGMVVEHELYDKIGVLFVSIEEEYGDYCFIEDRMLYLILHVAPSTEAMIEAFERNYFQPVETQE
jgi:multimeric flavodoxin WrbA